MKNFAALTQTFYSDYEELEKLPGLLDEMAVRFELSDEVQARLMLVLSEAVTNAIQHGNKLQRQKKAHLKTWVDPTKNRLYITVEDEGSGFNPAGIPNPLDDHNLLKPSGRGIYLMREYADVVSYNEAGNCLHIEIAL